MSTLWTQFQSWKPPARQRVQRLLLWNDVVLKIKIIILSVLAIGWRMRADRRKQQHKDRLWKRKIHMVDQQMKTRMLRLNKNIRSLICQVFFLLALSCLCSVRSQEQLSFIQTESNAKLFIFYAFIYLKTLSCLYTDYSHLSCFVFLFHVCIPSDFLNGRHFFLYGTFPNNERRLLSRYIIAFNG